MNEKILEVKNLTKNFKLHLLEGKLITAFSNISFALKRGEFIGIKGRSGSGKSSLLKCIYRTYISTEGEILYYLQDGSVLDLARCDERKILQLRHKDIGYVSQFFSPIPRISCQDLVADSLVIQGTPKDLAKKLAEDTLLKLSIPHNLFSSFPATFSGGEKQRVNIACSFVRKARLLLLDEPTASLDKENREKVLNEILKLKEKGVSAIGIFHDNKELRNFPDRIFDIEEKRFL